MHRPRRLTMASALAVITVLGGLTCAPAAADGPEPTILGDLCLRAQTQTANLRIVEFRRAGGTFENVVYPDLGGFAASKPQVQPLTTTRYNTYEDDAGTLLEQVRCKGKSADHIAAVYGAGVVGAEDDCAKVNQQTVVEAALMLTPAERRELVHRPDDIVIDPDTPAVTGQDWLTEFPAATKDAHGKIHLPSKSLYVPLNTPGIPDAFKGQHYCTLAAHSYVKGLMLGRVQP
ncbi:hypothetical protein [Nocardia brasiliensis]|uniref:hypothetical protein n=1 Tax=Nocardia brasiliensis TaxID=37326 RepID=UPI00366B1B09